MYDFTRGGDLMLSDFLYTSVSAIATSFSMELLIKRKKKKRIKKLKPMYGVLIISL